MVFRISIPDEEQLAASANIIRNAVAKRTGNGMEYWRKKTISCFGVKLYSH